MFDIDLLASFLAVLDQRGFTAAARFSNSTQSTVSAKISRLEEQAGHRLLNRNKRGIISLTAAGEVVEGMAREVVRLQRQAYRTLNEEQVRGKVRIGMSDDIASGRAYIKVLSEFCARQPGINIEVVVGNGSQILDDYDNGELDHVFLKTGNDLPSNAIELWTERLVWVGKMQEEDDLRLITFTSPCRYRERAIAILQRQEMPWREVYVSPSLAGIRAAVGAGFGVTILPVSLASNDLHVISPGVLPNPGVMVFALISRDSLDDPANSLFRELMSEVVPPVIDDI